MIDHDECLRIKNIETGRYDVKLAGKIGRVCQIYRSLPSLHLLDQQDYIRARRDLP
jgi:hypothetical protein